jgi:hypothetical protein
MSHLVTIRTEVRDREAVSRACRRLELPEPIEGDAKVFATWKKGLLVHLKDWEFPVVVDLKSGKVEYDNFEGHWGDVDRLMTFLQIYAVEKATMEARKRGHSVVEQPMLGGAIKLVIGVSEEAR